MNKRRFVVVSSAARKIRERRLDVGGFITVFDGCEVHAMHPILSLKRILISVEPIAKVRARLWLRRQELFIIPQFTFLQFSFLKRHSKAGKKNLFQVQEALKYLELENRLSLTPKLAFLLSSLILAAPPRSSGPLERIAFGPFYYFSCVSSYFAPLGRTIYSGIFAFFIFKPFANKNLENNGTDETKTHWSFQVEYLGKPKQEQMMYRPKLVETFLRQKIFFRSDCASTKWSSFIIVCHCPRRGSSSLTSWQSFSQKQVWESRCVSSGSGSDPSSTL